MTQHHGLTDMRKISSAIDIQSRNIIHFAVHPNTSHFLLRFYLNGKTLTKQVSASEQKPLHIVKLVSAVCVCVCMRADVCAHCTGGMRFGPLFDTEAG